MKLLEHFHELSIYPKNAKKLKGLILQLAVQGKLTAEWRKDNPDVEPASVLLDKIKSEKEQMIKNNIVKKEKPHPIIEKYPFEIPEKWKWARLSDISSINGGFAFKSSNYINQGVRVIRISDFDENGFKNNKIVRYSFNEGLLPYILDEKNILIAMTGGTVGKSLFVRDLQETMVVNQRVATIKLSKLIFEAFVNCVIPTKLIQDVIEESKNSTNDNISMSEIKGFNIPIPPLQEQKAIVSIVEKLFKEVKQLEQLTVERIQLKEKFAISALNQISTGDTSKEWEFLQQHFSSFFNEEGNIKKLRETILQLVVQGKLTKKWREANPKLIKGKHSAKALLEQIKKEKALRQAQGTLKKEKPLPPITEDEIPYKLPDGWVWCRVGDILETLSDYHANGSYVILKENTKLLDQEDYAIMLRTTNFHEKNRTNYKYITEEAYNFLSKSKVYPSDIIMNKIGDPGSVFWVNDRGKPMSLAMNLFLLRTPKIGELSRYLYFYLIGNEKYVRSFANGTSTLTITKDAVKKLIFPLPSLEEQKSIIEKVNTLMTLCDSLEQQVKQSKEDVEKLMKAVLRDVFEGEYKEVKELSQTEVVSGMAAEAEIGYGDE